MTIERHRITSRSEWLAWRRLDVTASEIAVISGLSPFKSSLRLWSEKTGEVEEQPETKPMRRGRLFEPGVIAMVQEEWPSWRITKADFYIRDTEARFGATPDYLASDGIDTFPVECKIIGPRMFETWGEPGSETPPVAYQLQNLSQQMLLDAPFGFLAVAIMDSYSADLRMFRIARHPPAEKNILAMVEAFWADVDAGKRPRADYARDGDLLAELHPPNEKIEPVDMSADNRLCDLLADREAWMSAKANLEFNIDAARAEIIQKLNGTPVVFCGDWRITNNMQHRKSYTVAAADFPALRVSKMKEKPDG